MDLKYLPDPNTWTTEDISLWLKWITREFKIVPEPYAERFPETGSELCSLTKADFWVVAGSKIGGNLLAKHMAHLIYSSTGQSRKSLLSDEDPGK